MAVAPVPKARLTREDYEALPEGPPYYELVNGELVEMTRPSESHNELAQVLMERWRLQLRQGPGGALSFEPNLYLPGVEDVYHPDLAYIAPEHQRIRRKKGIYGVPDVICEILSPTTERADRGLKLEQYGRAGVPHVWLISPERPVAVEEYVLGGEGRYRVEAMLAAPAEWEPAAFPGWRIPLAELDAAVAPVDED
jgi:Uma2 family endonuclease